MLVAPNAEISDGLLDVTIWAGIFVYLFLIFIFFNAEMISDGLLDVTH
jgi:hypothetical protein